LSTEISDRLGAFEDGEYESETKTALYTAKCVVLLTSLEVLEMRIQMSKDQLADPLYQRALQLVGEKIKELKTRTMQI